MLTLRLEIKPKLSTTFKGFAIFCSSPIEKKRVASANWRRETSTVALSIDMPLNNPGSAALIINLLKPSTTKRNGKRGSHCLIPLEAQNSSIDLSFMKTQKFTDCRQPFIHCLNLYPNPFGWKKKIKINRIPI